MGAKVYTDEDCGPDRPLFNACAAGERGECELMYNFVLNNAIVPTRTESNEVVFHSPSPDEEALVHAALGAGYHLVDREGPNIEIDVHGKRENFLKVQELSFTSERRRMSVIVRNRNVSP